MNTYRFIISFMLALGSLACKKDDSTGPDGPGNTQKMTFEASLDYENRVYDLGEPIKVEMTIIAKNTQEDHCMVNAVCYGGEATVALDGQDIEWNQQEPVYYEINNEAASSKKLFAVISPTPNRVSSQTLNIVFTFTSVDGKVSAEQRMVVNTINTSPITAKIQYSPDPIESQETIQITLAAEKTGFEGDFTVTPDIAEGQGYFILGNTQIVSKQSFSLTAAASTTIQYQPMSLGKHKILFIISDGVNSSEVSAQCEVYNNEGLTYPEDGIYIFVKNYQGKAFVSAKEYDPNAGLEVEGIAYLNDNLRILLPLHACEPLAICGSEDKLLSIPGIETSTLKYCGKNNTELIFEAYKSGIISSAPIIEACYNYDPINPGRWFLPSAHLLSTICYKSQIVEILKCMKLVGGTLFSDKKLFATSTVYLTDYTYGYDYLGFEYQLEYGRLLVGSNAIPRAYFPIRNL